MDQKPSHLTRYLSITVSSSRAGVLSLVPSSSPVPGAAPDSGGGGGGGGRNQHLFKSLASWRGSWVLGCPLWCFSRQCHWFGDLIRTDTTESLNL